MARHAQEWSKLSDDQRAAWLRLLRVHRDVVARLDDALSTEHGLTLKEWDALVHVAWAKEEGARMGDLAEVVLLTASGLTRLMERLEARGLVERRRGEGDARETYAAITQRGLDLLAEAAPTHNAELRAHFFDALSPQEVARLARSLEKVEEAAAAGCPRHAPVEAREEQRSAPRRSRTARERGAER